MNAPIDPTNHGGPPPPGPAGDAGKPKGPPPAYGSMTAKPMTFLGMHFTGPEAEKLWTVMIRQISSQIQKEQAKAIKALRKLRKSSTGQE